MLVLTRKVGERTRIEVAGVTIYVDVGEIDRNKVRLGFTAPPEVVILRQELGEYKRPAARPPGGEG